MKQPIFALVDCNNFFVSCERLFRPGLATRPVVVLSSNDGCAVSRSAEAKALGIPMGAPAFKYRQLFKDNGVVSFSANFELYGDISRRLTEILTRVTPRIEVYSVDESFLDLSELEIKDFSAWARVLREQVWKEIGIPVSIGIAGSKTLSKIATDVGKLVPANRGVCDIYHMSAEERLATLAQVPIRSVWGVGRKLAPQLQAEGVINAAVLSQLRPARARQLLGVHGEQMVLELNGTSCIPLERLGKPHQTISRGRTFGEDTNQAHVIEAALASFATQAAYRLRGSHQLARRAAIFLNSSRHKPNYRTWSSEVLFNMPTADTGQLIAAVVGAFNKIYDKQADYHRAGVWLSDFVPDHQLQTDLLGEVDPAKHSQRQARSAALDALNDRFGKNTVRYAAEDLAQAWQPKRMLRSPRYTTRWDELPTVKPLRPEAAPADATPR
jgi:DNA polymerase V